VHQNALRILSLIDPHSILMTPTAAVHSSTSRETSSDGSAGRRESLPILDQAAWVFARTGRALEGIETDDLAIAFAKQAAPSVADTLGSTVSPAGGTGGEGTG
jgi:hypothetical protein